MERPDGWKHTDVLPVTIALACIGCFPPLVAQLALMSAKPLATGTAKAATGAGGWMKRRAEAKAARKLQALHRLDAAQAQAKKLAEQKAEAARIAALPPPPTKAELLTRAADLLNRELAEVALIADEDERDLAEAEARAQYRDTLKQIRGV